MLSKKKRDIKTIGDFTYSQGKHTHLFVFVAFKVLPPTLEDMEHGTISVLHRFGVMGTDLKRNETNEDMIARIRNKAIEESGMEDAHVEDFVEVLKMCHADFDLEGMISKLPSFK